MCRVRCQYYECGHSFHEVEKSCPKFNKVLDDARKKSDLEDYRCEKHKGIYECQHVKPVNRPLEETSMIHIDDIHGPWSVARRKIVGGHCETPIFLGGRDRPGSRPRLEGKCRDCRKSWFRFWK